MQYIDRSIRLFHYLNSELRIRLVLLLNCYEELTLKQICSTLKKTKVTITNHLKGLYEIGILNIREENIRGPLVRKYYSIDPRSFQETIVKCEDFQSLSSEEKWNYLSEKANYDRYQYEFLKDLLGQIIPYLEHLRSKIIDYSDSGMEYKEPVYEHNKGENFFYPLNEDEYDIYKEETLDMMERIAKKFANLRAQNKYKKSKPFLAWHVVFPMRKFFEELSSLR